MASNKAFLKLATLAKGNRMKLNDRLVYSWLVYRLARGRGSMKLGISKATSLHPHTVRQCIQRLEAGYLVERRDGRWHALKGPMFCFKGNGEWHQQLRYAKILLPTKSCPLTIPQVVIFSLLHNGVQKRIQGLAKIAGVAPNTVRSALRKLQVLGLIDGDGKAYELSEEQASWFRDKPPKVQRTEEGNWPTFDDCIVKRFPKLLIGLERSFDGSLDIYWLNYIKTFARVAGTAGYPYNESFEFLSQKIKSISFAMPVGKLLRHLAEYVEKAEQRTKSNRKRGKYYGKTSFGLFRMMVGDFESVVKNKVAG